MKKLLVLLFFLGLMGGTVVPALGSTWVSTHCNTNWYTRSIWRTSDAYAYALVAVGEGYKMGGGCWNNNNIDDTPHQPDSSGEGPDCSGLVFKTWALDNVAGANDLSFRYRYKEYKEHGPYDTAVLSGRSGTDPKFYNLSTSSRKQMDAFAWNTKTCHDDNGNLIWCGHTGLFVQNNANGTIKVIEAKGDEAGVVSSNVTWHTDTNHPWKLARRNGWSPSCAPNCL